MLTSFTRWSLTPPFQWGLIGPGLQFSKGQIYYALTFLFIVGAFCPVIFWLITRRYRGAVLNYLQQVAKFRLYPSHCI